MTQRGRLVLPQARREGLVVQELAEEVLVYDTERHKAHCLNPMAAAVWRHCDGQTTVAEIVRRLQQELSAPVDGAVVWSAIAQLEKARLLTGEVRGQGDEGGLTRRELMRMLGVAAASIPLVTTIAAPRAAQAASCIDSFDPCTPGAGLPCCPGFECTTQPFNSTTTSLCVPTGAGG